MRFRAFTTQICIVKKTELPYNVLNREKSLTIRIDRIEKIERKINMSELINSNVQEETEELKNGDKRIEMLNTFKTSCVELFKNEMQKKYAFFNVNDLFTENSTYPTHPLADLDDNLKRKYFNLFAYFSSSLHGSNFLRKLNHGLGLNDFNLFFDVLPIEEVNEITKVVIEKGMQPVLIFELLAAWSMKMKHNIEFFGGVDNTSSDFDKSTDELGKFINDILIAFDMTADELEILYEFTLAFISGNFLMYTSDTRNPYDALACYAEHIPNPTTKTIFTDFPEKIFDDKTGKLYGFLLCDNYTVEGDKIRYELTYQECRWEAPSQKVYNNNVCPNFNREASNYSIIQGKSFIYNYEQDLSKEIGEFVPVAKSFDIHFFVPVGAMVSNVVPRCLVQKTGEFGYKITKSFSV